MNNAPISVVIPVYNEKNAVAQCLQSLLSQTILPMEVIVLINASTDKSREIIE